MTDENFPDKREPGPNTSRETCDPTPTDAAGAKLFVIFFLAIVPLLGFAIVGMVIYRMLVR